MAKRFFRLFGPVRVRTTVAATLVVALALSLGAAVLVVSLRGSLERGRQNAVAARAADIAGLAASGHLPSVLGLPDEEATLAQVVDQNGHVIAASANLEGEPPIGPFLQPGVPATVRTISGLPTNGGRFRLVAQHAQLAGQPVTVYAAVSLATVDQAVRTLTLRLFIGLPVLLLVVAGTAWVVVGRALRPIEAIRAEVADITTRALDRRVPEPAADDEVGRLARTMNSMLDGLEASVQRQRRFVGDASHELRSPLTAIRTQLEVGLAREGITDWPATVKDVLTDEARMEGLVADLLLLARLDGQRLPPAAVPVDLDDIVRQVLGNLADPPGITTRYEVVGPSSLQGRPEQLSRLVSNLVENAQRHASSEVIIKVGYGDDSDVVLEVADDGPGIAPADRERVFERFTRLDSARRRDDGGAGLGLAIVREIAVRHGGRVAFADAAAGARVIVRLPSAPASGSAET